jgi:hypothetical protein
MLYYLLVLLLLYPEMNMLLIIQFLTSEFYFMKVDSNPSLVRSTGSDSDCSAYVLSARFDSSSSSSDDDDDDDDYDDDDDEEEEEEEYDDYFDDDDETDGDEDQKDDEWRYMTASQQNMYGQFTSPADRTVQ